MMYIKTDGEKKFFKCQECAEGCKVRVSLEWGRKPPCGTMASSTAMTTRCLRKR